MLFVECLVGFTQLLQAFGRNFSVFSDTVLLLDDVKGDFEVLVLNFHDDIANHVDQAAVSVVCEPLIVSGGC